MHAKSDAVAAISTAAGKPNQFKPIPERDRICSWLNDPRPRNRRPRRRTYELKPVSRRERAGYKPVFVSPSKSQRPSWSGIDRCLRSDPIRANFEHR